LRIEVEITAERVLGMIHRMRLEEGAADGQAAALVGGIDQAVEPFGGVCGDR
jgi:hypothetical protein